ncbi:hypothetical protein FDI69_gp107 [Rhodococcus phage Trina]|uniref:Uncharacterized protein n=1 Tax=Rhodococcus phage Trina TaxID=2027905 RepID=A0A2D0ZN05_9CAUD|nr:hypothetical protein FDI69_gp107 [Rhodococcus phage Trina]ASZ74921.1 hypothetical protein SEA_TRINA_107 [Rhodococcus phage Trina]
MTEEQDILRDLNSVAEFNDISKLLNDPTIDKALTYTIQLLAKPDVPAKVAAPLIVELEAMAFKFKMQGKSYMIINKSQPKAAEKKNIYLSMSEGLQRLADSLKYLVRTF